MVKKMFSGKNVIVIFMCAVVITNGQPEGIRLSKRTATQENTTPKFCSSSYIPPEKPDFRAPGRRINEEKCMEYVWELKNRKQVNDEIAICAKYQQSRGGHLNSPLGGIGDRTTTPGEFPHRGALGWKAVDGTWVFKCGSSLISEKFVLTAAHCTKATPTDTRIADLEPKIVRIGDKNIIDKLSFGSPPRVDAMISRIIKHPNYKPPLKYYDIALIELDQVVTFSKYVQPACLWNSFSTSELGSQAIGTAWGVTNNGSPETSLELQTIVFDVLETDHCDRLLENLQNRRWQGFMEHQLCAGALSGGVDSCRGDSGGPLQMKIQLPKDITDAEGTMSYLIGIDSFGAGCARPNLPEIYTRVSSFIDWIEENVWSN